MVRSAFGEVPPDSAAPGGPSDRAELLAWYDDSSGALLDLLSRSTPDTPCWTFGPPPHTARFWFRRQAHEHAVHALDAHASQGRVAPVDPALALDGVDEVDHGGGQVGELQGRAGRGRARPVARQVEPDEVEAVGQVHDARSPESRH